MPLDALFGEQAERSGVSAFGRIGQTQGDHFRFLFAVQFLDRRETDIPFFVGQADHVSFFMTKPPCVAVLLENVNIPDFAKSAYPKIYDGQSRISIL